MREIVIGGAQMGPIQKTDSREAVVERMISLLTEAKRADCNLVVFPELCLTTFFPRWYIEKQSDLDAWFESKMPNEATAPLFVAARKARIAICFGYAELTPNGQYFNTSILTDNSANIIGKYRKVHLPGHSEYDTERAFQHLEKRYFEPGDLGFPVWKNLDTVMGMCICNDRRWPEVYRVMGLRGVELIMLGYNTPSVNSQMANEGPEGRLYHSELVMTSGAYQNSTWVVGIAKSGLEDGHPLIGGSVIIDPNGYVVSRANGTGDELIVHACDMDTCAFGKTTVFDFSRHRRTEHYQLICSQTGSIPPS
ncbi:MAG: N-carbamoyl-D-amino-acid hydrolase [Paracoccaceae bacterium]|nr:N-carbamoyl-D-amino-acid hydrolase [Paracoccaceae bacterium]